MNLPQSALWAVAATIVMTMIYEISQGLGFSRINLPFLFGTVVTSRRSWANVIGAFLYMLGGWVFALGYWWVFDVLSLTSWTSGLVLGLFHGLFLLTVFLPLLPYVHPRVATEYDSPTYRQRIEPPGFLGLNYGLGTPLTTLIAQCAFGLVMQIGYGG